MKTYPLQFESILKERIWGGKKLKKVLNKPITSAITGESWELSAVKGDVSVIANGVWKGKSLMDIIDKYPNEILGTDVSGRSFLCFLNTLMLVRICLFKFIPMMSWLKNVIILLVKLKCGTSCKPMLMLVLL